MSNEKKERGPSVYYIPHNIFDGFSLLGRGTRFWVEAVLFSVLPGYLLWVFLPFTDLILKMVVTVAIAVPILVFSLLGIRGEPLTRFIATYIRFQKGRRIYLYRYAGDGDFERPPYFELEKEVDDLGIVLADTTDKAEAKEIRATLKQMRKRLNAEIDDYSKTQARADEVKQKKRDADREKNLAEITIMANAFIERERAEGKKLKKKDVKRIHAEYQDDFLLSLPVPPQERDFVSQTQSAQDYLPIEKLENGIIYTKGGRLIKILGVSPINLPMFSPDQQDIVISNFGLLLRSSPVRVQLKTMAKSADVEGFIQKMRKNIDKEPSEKAKIMMRDYIDTLRENATQNAVSRQFFYVVEYDETFARADTTESEKIRELENVCQRARQAFRRCGNIVYDFSSSTEEVDFLYSMFFDTLERFNASGFSYDDKIDFAYEQGSQKIDAEISATDFISPTSLDFTHPKFVVIDDVYYGYLYIPSNGYRTDVTASWLFPIINAGGGVDVDVFFERADREQIKGATRRQINLSSGLMKDQRENTDSFDSLFNKAQSAHYIKEGLVNGEDFFNMFTLITIIALDEESLLSRMKSVQTLFSDLDMSVQACDYYQEEAFLAALPLCSPPPNLFNLGRRNVLTHDASSVFPFSSYEMMDDNGILVGTNVSNGSLVMPDVFDGKKYKNANMYIIGSSGAGKTYNLITQAQRTRQMGIQTFIIAPLKGNEFVRSCEAIDGAFVSVAPGSSDCINIMAIRKRDEEAVLMGKILDGDDNFSVLSDKMSSLETFFSIMIPDMDLEEEQLLNNMVQATYARFDITPDNDSLVDPTRPGEFKTMPVLGDLYDDLRDIGKLERVRTILSKYVTGTASNFSGQTNVDLDNEYVVIDISRLSKKDMPIGMFIALDYIWDKVKEDRSKTKRIFIDEIWHLMGTNAPLVSAEFVMEIFKTIRGFGGGAVAATQELDDFFALEGGAYGRKILNACTLGMVMKTEATALPFITETLQLEAREERTILELERGQALILGGSNSVVVKIVASDHLHMLITTNTADIVKFYGPEVAKLMAKTGKIPSFLMGVEGVADLMPTATNDDAEMTTGERLAAARTEKGNARRRMAQISRKDVRL